MNKHGRSALGTIVAGLLVLVHLPGCFTDAQGDRFVEQDSGPSL